MHKKTILHEDCLQGSPSKGLIVVADGGGIGRSDDHQKGLENEDPAPEIECHGVQARRLNLSLLSQTVLMGGEMRVQSEEHLMCTSGYIGAAGCTAIITRHQDLINGWGQVCKCRICYQGSLTVDVTEGRCGRWETALTYPGKDQRKTEKSVKCSFGQAVRSGQVTSTGCDLSCDLDVDVTGSAVN